MVRTFDVKDSAIVRKCFTKQGIRDFHRTLMDIHKTGRLVSFRDGDSDIINFDATLQDCMAGFDVFKRQTDEIVRNKLDGTNFMFTNGRNELRNKFFFGTTTEGFAKMSVFGRSTFTANGVTKS